MTYPLTAGFGYVWGASTVDLLGGSCDFSPYEPTRAAASGAGANTRIRLRIARGTEAVSLRIHGTHGPPKVVLRGPHGSTITSPTRARAKLSKGHYLLVENKTDGTTNVMLVRPAAGTWTMSQAPGSASSPDAIDRANLEVPPTFGARVLGTGGLRTCGWPTRCRWEHRCDSSSVRRASTTRSPRPPRPPVPGPPQVRAPAPTRRSYARASGSILRRAGRHAQGPGDRDAAWHPATAEEHRVLQRAAQDAAVLASRRSARERGRGFLMVAFSRSLGASRYSVSAKLSDGRELAFDIADGAVRCVSQKSRQGRRGVKIVACATTW